MSISSYQSDIVRLQRDIATCDKDSGREQDKIARLTKEISDLERSMVNSNSASSFRSKTSQVANKMKEMATAKKKLGEINIKKAQKQAELNRKHKSLKSAEIQESKSQEQKDLRRRESELRYLREIANETERQRRLKYELAAAPQFLDLKQLPEKIKVLFLASNPEDQVSLRLDVEVRGIQEKIRASEHRDSVDFITRWAVRPTDLLQHLNEHDPHVLHFSGHGARNGDIIFEGPNGESTGIKKDAIVQLIKTTASNVRLVVFNSCFSRDQAEAVTQYVDSAIGMNTAIGDEAAQVFASQFYSAIGFGKSIRIAFDQAKLALILQGIQEDTTPELFIRNEIDAENIYLVRPEGNTSVPFVRSPTSILPGLKQEDICVLEAACESEARSPNVCVTLSELVDSLQSEEQTEEAIEESVSNLVAQGFLEQRPPSRQLIYVTNLGFDKYATLYIENYADITRNIADAIVNQDVGDINDVMNFVPDVDVAIVKRILYIFKDRGFVELIRPFGSPIIVSRWNPSLKRWFEMQD